MRRQPTSQEAKWLLEQAAAKLMSQFDRMPKKGKMPRGLPFKIG
ncbi:MAG: hypothetical protein ACRDJC_13260 [Thermomicrobiales bacterium]